MILDWLERRRLVRKGLACDKTRLSHSEDNLPGRMEGSWTVRLLILSVFIVLLHLGVAWGNPDYSRVQQIFAFIVFISGLMLLELDCSEVWRSNSRLILVLGAMWFNLVVVFLLWRTYGMATLYFVSPCTFAPFLITLLLGTRAGLFTVVQVSMLASLLTGQDFTLLLISLLSGFTAVYFTQNVRKRFDLLKAGFAVGSLNLLCTIVLGFLHRGSLTLLGEQALFGVGAGIFVALVVSAILPVVEIAFQITTTISWLELADLNHPLLQQMTMEAPGTYHHSLLVANIAESGAKAIGLDPTACRVMAYFHDVGKIIKPEYFTENIPPGANPHENLSPSMSALIIIAHVKEGIDLAIKYRLKKAGPRRHPATSRRFGGDLFSPARPPAATRRTRRRQDHEHARGGCARRLGKLLPLSGTAPANQGDRPTQHRRCRGSLLALAGKADGPADRGFGERNRRAQDRRPPARRVSPDAERGSCRGGSDGRHGKKHDAHPYLLR